MSQTERLLDSWLEALLATPGLTAIRDPTEARRVHVEDSLRAVDVVRRFAGPVADVGSGGGAPGIPLATALPDREVTLIDANRRKCAFLERWAGQLPNLRVVCGRVEEQEPERYGVAVAKALASPPVAAEWCLGLVAPGGAAVLFAGPSADLAAVKEVAELLGGDEPQLEQGLIVIPKAQPLPAGFPRRTGVARKRPLA